MPVTGSGKVFHSPVASVRRNSVGSPLASKPVKPSPRLSPNQRRSKGLHDRHGRRNQELARLAAAAGQQDERHGDPVGGREEDTKARYLPSGDQAGATFRPVRR